MPVNPQLIEARTVLLIDLPEKASKERELFENTIRAALEYYRKVYGMPKRVWVNSKDAHEEVETVDGMQIERRGGCVRGKLMVM